MEKLKYYSSRKNDKKLSNSQRKYANAYCDGWESSGLNRLSYSQYNEKYKDKYKTKYEISAFTRGLFSGTRYDKAKFENMKEQFKGR